MKEDNLIRDPRNSAVLNVDKVGFLAYKKDIENSRKFLSTVNDVENLKKDVKEIKDMLQIIIDGLKKNG